MPWNREGTCNRCGQCCGAIGTGQPDRRSPFPRNWPEAIRHWSFDDAVQSIPQTGLCGLGQIGEDTIGVNPAFKEAKIQNKRFYYIWVPDIGLVKDTSLGHDGSQWVPECPFLEYPLIGDPDPANPMACGLIGTIEEGAYDKFCRDEPITPCSTEIKNEWEWRYPDCSYTWTEVP